MKISNELRAQAERYSRSGSFNLNNILKNELGNWSKEHKNKPVNIQCGTCLRNSMRDLVAALANDTKPAIKKIPFQGIVQEAPKTIDEMTYKELKAMAKERGIKGTHKRTELIELLTNA